ncbi:MAG: response regulator, partial [Oscillospiraceae bacterium]|nr:response regulator [Oscillospiraceae bacterium]
MKTIFVVDDNDTNLVVAQQALEGEYKTLTIPSAAKMFKLLEKITPDLILLDIEMPEMDGFAAITELKKSDKFRDIPVIFLTANCDAELEVKGFELGAVDYVNKPFSAPVLRKRLETNIGIDALVKERTAEVESLRNGIISVLADMVEGRDIVTGGHIRRTQTYLKILLDAMTKNKVYSELTKSWDLQVALPSAQLHDIGKITVSDTILNKPGKLSAEEFEIIKTHSIEGEKL